MTFMKRTPTRLLPPNPSVAMPRIAKTFAHRVEQLKSLLMRGAKEDALREIDDLEAHYLESAGEHYTTDDALDTLERIRDLTRSDQFNFALSELEAASYVRRFKDIDAAYVAATGRE